ncbi:ricin-type beta-trefoil lectin protein [Streptomyces sp. SLBN-118]|uniref:ricin-type beta-trefoil lectin domain protein n=1 Tax=Streptomyces sp. SLBN-118 TaxID=2768454 RepID=UPI0011681329|nr:ricin-type beta-trefoil lectin domain protein [Streptomyces sp. SLBN-118]TQK52407.1 ricin-type beta-trefoil lectin protein [Streptomyces sp. SLBN-118]
MTTNPRHRTSTALLTVCGLMIALLMGTATAAHADDYSQFLSETQSAYNQCIGTQKTDGSIRCNFVGTRSYRYTRTNAQQATPDGYNCASTTSEMQKWYTDTTATTNSVTITGTVTSTVIPDVLEAGISVAYGYSVTDSHSDTTTLTIKIPPSYVGWIEHDVPMVHVEGYYVVHGNSEIDALMFQQYHRHLGRTADGGFLVFTNTVVDGEDANHTSPDQFTFKDRPMTFEELHDRCGKPINKEGKITLQSKGTGRCLDSNFNGDVYASPCSSWVNPHQRWDVFTYADGGTRRYLRNAATGRCLDSNAWGSVYTMPCQLGNGYQYWMRGGDSSLLDNTYRDAQTGLTLDGDSNGNIYTLAFNGWANQVWHGWWVN